MEYNRQAGYRSARPRSQEETETIIGRMPGIVLLWLSVVLTTVLFSIPAQAADFTFQINTSTDDARQDIGSGSVDTNGTSLELGRQDRLYALRFPGINIAPGTIITNAEIQFFARDGDTNPVTANIVAQDADNAATFTETNFDISSRSTTTANIDWDIPTWINDTSGAAQTTPDLTNLVQEVVNRGGWSSGNALAFVFSHVSGDRRRASSFDDGTQAPVLRISTAEAGSSDMSVTISDDPDPVTVNELLTYTITVTNRGPETATNATVIDALPGNVVFISSSPSQGSCSGTATVTCNLGTLTQNSSATVDITVRPYEVGTLSNTASVSATEPDDKPSNDSATVSTTVNPSATTNISATSDDAEEKVSDGAMNVTRTELQIGDNDRLFGFRFPNIAIPQGTVITNAEIVFYARASDSNPVLVNITAQDADDTTTFTQTNFNISSRPQTSASVNWDIQPWTNDETGPDTTTPDLTELVQEVVNRPGWSSGNALTFFVSRLSGDKRRASSIEESPAEAPILRITTAAPASADLELSITDSPDPVNVSENLTYTITVTNRGPETATNVTVTDTLPGSVAFVSASPSQGSCSGTTTVTCDLSTLTQGSSAQIDITVTPNVIGTISNTASVAATELDSNSSNDSATASTTVGFSSTTPVNATSDDARQSIDNGDMNVGETELQLGASNRLNGIRFPDINVPQGAVITSARIWFYARASDSNAVTVNITAQDADDSATFTTTDFDIANRPQTSANVDWDIPAWIQDDFGANTTTPDLKLLVQEIVNRPGWSGGNALTFFISPVSGDRRRASTTEEDPAEAPILLLTFSDSDLSTSTKTVQDLNGGDAEPGDTLRYTITLQESSGISDTGMSVFDDIPASTTSFSVVSIPAGASDNSTGDGTGANGTGFLSISDISIAAGGTAQIVFDVMVDAGASAGTVISNTAVINNPGGVGASPSASNVTVSAADVPASGNKPLYLDAPSLDLSRIPSSSTTDTTITNGSSQTWTMTPVSQADLTLRAGDIPISLLLIRNNPLLTPTSRTVQVTLAYSGASSGTIGSETLAFADLPTASPTPQIFTVNLASDLTLSAGTSITLEITNDTGGITPNRNILVRPSFGGNNSIVDLFSETVINVDSVEFYNAAYPDATLIAGISPGQTFYARAVVSDPFGSFDITGASIDITDPNDDSRVTAAAMTEVADSGVATKIYEYAYSVPASGQAGFWTARITADEGTEGLVSDVGVNTIQVSTPSILATKSVVTESDPVNGAANPKAIPGALLRYTIAVTNYGNGSTDNDSIEFDDAIPANAVLYVADLGGGGSGPVVFSDGATASGLTFTFSSLASTTDDLAFSNNEGATFTYTPVPDADGYDANVTDLRVLPKGQLLASDGINNPEFTVQFRVRVQ